jgi:DNA helicase HerA-like ATPase
MLDLSEAQKGIMAVVFKYCDDNDIPLVNLNDLRKTLNYMTDEGKEEIEEMYGRLSTNSVSAILRKLIELEQQGADRFFGERSFDVQDLLRTDKDGRGVVSIVRLTDIQDRPMLFSTFMLQMMAEIYSTFPEEGDTDKPKLVIFIDEAHLVFDEASDTLLDQLEVMVKLIRSKGVGLYFVTQNPVDIPESVLSQLGFKLQHALRAFTAKDRKAIRLAAQNFPETDYYDVDELLTQLGIGEALITALNEKGIPTPLVHTMLRAPQSRMDVLTQREINRIIDRSDIIDHYNEEIDRESAEEILQKKIDFAKEADEIARKQAEKEKIKKTSRKKEESVIEQIMNNTTTRQIGRTVARELTRGLLSVLGAKRR